MKPWQLLIVALALLASAGCRSDPAIPILERELRRKEDEIYRLRATLEGYRIPARPTPSGIPASSRSAESERGAIASPSVQCERRQQPPVAEMPSQPTTEVPDLLKTPAGASPSGVPEVPKELQGPSKPLGPSEHAPDRRSSRRIARGRPSRSNWTVRCWNKTSATLGRSLPESHWPRAEGRRCHLRRRATADGWPRSH